MALDSAIVEQWSDPVWRLHNLYWIVDKGGQKVRFTPNDAQLTLINSMHGKDIILKARQMGFTTLCCIVGLDECLFNKDWRAAIIAHKLDDAKGIFETKVKYPYDNLPDPLKARLALVKDSADTLHFSNGSSISVTTSARSGTFQRLHISEFGKICAKHPDKAREIVTGSLPAAERGCVTIESTAEGQEGRFFEMVQTAREREPTSRREWKFHFFPWWKQEEYTAPPEFAVITDEDKRYFEDLAVEGIELTDGQKAWWVLTEKDQGGDMRREYPATPDEAFEQAIEGAIFSTQLAHSAKHQRIGTFPHDPRYPVSSFWDLGRNDNNAIWLHQRIKSRNRFVGYYENSGEYIAHYINWLKEWAKVNDAKFDAHFLPHDGDRDDLFLENGRVGVMDDLGFQPVIVGRVRDKWDAVEAARNVFSDCDFDEAACGLGLKRLRHYRKEWDERRGVFKNRPLHDVNSNGADAFMTFSTNYNAPAEKVYKPRRRRSAWAA
jgi:hypothetical protein